MSKGYVLRIGEASSRRIFEMLRESEKFKVPGIIEKSKRTVIVLR